LALEPQLIPNPIQPDETNHYSKSLKIKIPTQTKIRNHIVWNPILSEEIKVLTKNPDEDWIETIQINRDINREIIEQVLDLEEFIWKQRTLPEGKTSTLPELYDQQMVVPKAEADGIYLYRYSVQKLSEIAQKIIQLESQKPIPEVQNPHQKFNANNHLILKLFNLADLSEKNYNKFQYPDYPNSEKERNNMDMERLDWFKIGLFEDAQRMNQVFRQFPPQDQDLFDDYQIITKNLMLLKSETQDRHTKSKKLALFYELILIATKNLPNKITFVEEETESPDFGKLLEKD
jgi:hypothetical protein